MIDHTPVSDIMTRRIIAIDRTESLARAERLFKKHRIRHIPVVKAESIIGMLSYSDLLKISFADIADDLNADRAVYDMFSVEQIMTKNLVSITSKTSIKEAAEILTEHEFHALPVIDDSILVGIITSTDLIKYLILQI